MKRILIFFLMVVPFAMSANAQRIQVGLTTRAFTDVNGVVYEQGQMVYYKKGRNGKVGLFSDAEKKYNVWVPSSNIKFSGYYVGTLKDSDGYVNVRKGPGMNYPVVKKLYLTGDDATPCVFFKTTNTNWHKVYEFDQNGEPGMYLGYIYYNRIVDKVD